MGVMDEADRTLFVGNLDPQVTEELLFELFLQAGPLLKVKIPKDGEGKSKHFAFVNFKHEVSVPYGMNLLNGIRLFGRQLNIQYRAGSSHLSQEGRSPANSQNSSPSNTPNHRGGRYDRTPEHVGSPSCSPPQNLQRGFSSPETLSRQAMMNNMWQVQMQQLQQLNGLLGTQQQFRGGNSGPWQQESLPYRSHRHSQQDNSGHHGRDHRHGSNHRHDGQQSEFYQHDDRGGGRSRDYPSDRRRDTRDGGRDGRWKQF